MQTVTDYINKTNVQSLKSILSGQNKTYSKNYENKKN